MARERTLDTSDQKLETSKYINHLDTSIVVGKISKSANKLSDPAWISIRKHHKDAL